MEEEPGVLEELGNVLTNIRISNSDLFYQSEKLLEVIQLELKHVVIPEIAEGQSVTTQWSDGTTNIFISIHVEGEDQFSYSIEITGTHPKD